jgi:transcription initiation factor TFIID TATA-box-binding protein
MISTGAKSVPMSIWQLQHAMNLLVRNKLTGRVNLVCKVQNIVATLDLQRRFDVKKVISKLANYIYEPDNFPGIIYRSSRGTSCLLFTSGKVVVAGAKSENQLNDTAKEINKIVE